MQGSSKSETPPWPAHGLAFADILDGWGWFCGRCMVERSHQVPSHEGHPEASSNLASNISSNANGYDQHMRWIPVPWNECLATSRAGDKPSLIMSWPDKCFSRLFHRLLDSSLLFLLRHCRAFMYKRCKTLERWRYLQLLRLPPMCYWLMNTPISSTACIFSKGQSLFAQVPALCKQTISTPSLPDNSPWATDSAFVKNTNTKLTVK